ncbi:hypothetical protein [Vallitalea okinawensis]|uniref:hypothetical protein n=1 Tax=Vallitalea okinawensis TaxID=2078660 RepID=UPI000CFB57F6|nr:hypothetical protein [Vallitalea okinawensis]
MKNMFPRTDVGGVSLPRMIIGTNWIVGYSHTSVAADNHIKEQNGTVEKIVEILKVFLRYDINAIMGGIGKNPLMQQAIKEAENQTGKKIIIIDTPAININDDDASRKEAEKRIALSKEIGATFCLPHHSSVEKLVNRNKKTIDRLPDYLKMIRKYDMIPGLSCHMPELIVYSDLNDYDVETYIQIYNCMGFLMQVEIEYIHKVIWNAKKPVMTIKSMAAGRVSPFVGLTFSYNTIRPCDMVTVGCLTPDEASEDIEIALAALDRRPPQIKGRSSFNKTEIMKD